MLPILSVIIPVYNQSQYIARCINSLKIQNSEDFEVIIIDDGSIDDSLAIIKKEIKQLTNFSVKSKSNGGLSSARNFGIELVKGKYVTFLDSDDFVTEDYIKKIINAIHYSDSDMILMNFNLWSIKKGNYINRSLDIRLKEKIYTPEILLEELLKFKLQNYSWILVCKRRLFNYIIFPEGFHFEDIATMYRFIELSNSIYFIKDRIYNYVQHESSFSSNITLKSINDLYAISTRRYEDINKKYSNLKYWNERNYSFYLLDIYCKLCKIENQIEFKLNVKETLRVMLKRMKYRDYVHYPYIYKLILYKLHLVDLVYILKKKLVSQKDVFKWK